MKKLDGSLPELGWALYEPAETELADFFSEAVTDTVGALPKQWVVARDKTEILRDLGNLLIPSSLYYYLEAVHLNGFSRFSTPNTNAEFSGLLYDTETTNSFRKIKGLLTVLGYSYIDAIEIPSPRQSDVFCSVGIVYEPGASLGGSTIRGTGHRDVLKSDGTIIMSHLPNGQPKKEWLINQNEVTQPSGTVLVLGRDPAYTDRDIQTPHHYVEAGDERIVSFTFQAIGTYGSRIRLALAGVAI